MSSMSTEQVMLSPSTQFCIGANPTTGLGFLDAECIALQFIVPTDGGAPPCVAISVDGISCLDWEGFDEHAANLSLLSAVVIGLASLDDLDRFINMVEPRMARLQAASSLRYAIWNGKHGALWRWIKRDSVISAGMCSLATCPAGCTSV